MLWPQEKFCIEIAVKRQIGGGVSEAFLVVGGQFGRLDRLVFIAIANREGPIESRHVPWMRRFELKLHCEASLSTRLDYRASELHVRSLRR